MSSISSSLAQNVKRVSEYKQLMFNPSGALTQLPWFMCKMNVKLLHLTELVNCYYCGTRLTNQPTGWKNRTCNQSSLWFQPGSHALFEGSHLHSSIFPVILFSFISLISQHSVPPEHAQTPLDSFGFFNFFLQTSEIIGACWYPHFVNGWCCFENLRVGT